MKQRKINNKMRFKYRVAGVAIDQDMVLVHQFEGSEYWSLPGGNVELGESSAAALHRELLEEANLQVEVGRLLWVHENLFVQKSGKQVHELCFYYLIDFDHEKMARFGGAEGETRLFFRWVRLEELDGLPLVPAFLKTQLFNLPTHPEHLVSLAEWDFKSGFPDA